MRPKYSSPGAETFICLRMYCCHFDSFRSVLARADGIVVEGVIDAEIAHLHAAEVLVARRRNFHLLENVLLPFRQFRSCFAFAAARRGLLRLRLWCRGSCDGRRNS